ncbi:TPA: hypothetical protein ACX3DX_004553 [Vibrio parahaemolyticus]|uniref:hypothetical protein n=1 Tax=Vibrio harveyi group TaxID=717610 RepID=UPI0011222D84|nr:MULTISPECIES: hypothetical protein [Vibrio harveyi group]MBT0082600.1 hypothetical protein [Vibrio alginolyticus]MBT0105847.1 hypothetical protein [Vibrio alginolyticus]TOQ64558.1 hypothetical protein CGG90_23835 [Vibrio parahaemolyticus]
MDFLQQYAKEIFALSVPLLTWFLNFYFKAKAKLHVASPHGFTFLVEEPVKDENGEIVSPRQTVKTMSHIVSNPGQDTATKVELVFNWKPPCINIWPSRHFIEHEQNDGRYVMVFDSLAPREQIACELLSVNNDLPALINVRSDQCTATQIAMFPQPVVALWKQRVSAILMFLGLSLAIYIGTVFLQFLLTVAQ